MIDEGVSCLLIWMCCGLPMLDIVVNSSPHGGNPAIGFINLEDSEGTFEVIPEIT